MTILKVFVVLAAVSAAHAYFAPAWGDEHNGTQIWMGVCPNSDCPSSIARLHDHIDILSHTFTSFGMSVKKENMNSTKELLKNEGFEYQIMIGDFAQYLKGQHDFEMSSPSVRSDTPCTSSSNCPAPLKEEYMTFEQMEWFLTDLSTTYSDIVTLTIQGTTTENRNLYLVKVTAPKTVQTGILETKHAVLIEGGAHAREWVSSATVLNILYAQVKKCSTNTDCDSIYYFMPAMNPDGYEFSWTNDRLWRKNRSKAPSGNCHGIDINRNYGHYYGSTGTSTQPCSNVYRGLEAFDAPETATQKKVLDVILNESQFNLDLYLSYHAYGQIIMYPWGYQTNQPIPDSKRQIAGAELYRDVLKSVNDVTYSAENSAALYAASGASDDYAKSRGAKLVYTVELRDTGRFGFVLPASQIKGVFDENWAAFKALDKYAKEAANGDDSLLSECCK